MITSIKCVPCILRSTLLAAQMASKNEAEHAEVVHKVLRLLSETDLSQTPPQVVRQIQYAIREVTGVADPFQRAKAQLNEIALALLPKLKAQVRASSNPLYMAVRLAIAGNAMDMGAVGKMSRDDIKSAVDKTLQDPFWGEYNAFEQALSQATSVLYLADNSGEIAFDRILIEELLPKQVTLVVRGGPTLNDATLHDAQAVGLDRLVEVIDNGFDAPGTILDHCSPAFVKRFWDADLVIAKGQGNYETLNTVPADIFFLLKAKCEPVRDLVNQPIGTQVLIRAEKFTPQMEPRNL